MAREAAGVRFFLLEPEGRSRRGNEGCRRGKRRCRRGNERVGSRRGSRRCTGMEFRARRTR
eukprot:2599292-Prymnesium_polylepis.1